MKKQFLETGEIVAAQGLNGEVRIYPWSDSPDFLCTFKRFYLAADGTGELTVEQIRPHKNLVVAKFAGVSCVEDTPRLRGKTLYINRDDCELEEGDFFVQDLEGLSVYDVDSGVCYGTLSEVSQTGANDVYHIQAPGKKDKLVPAIPQVVLHIDIEGGRMDIRPLEGLFDED